MTFLTVPYAEKDEARALGARWNPTRKRWYVPPGVALDAFEKWLPEDGAREDANAKPGPKSAGTAPGGRVDAYAAKLVKGSLYLELPHDCNPFHACPVCAPQLATSGWTAARAKLLETLGQLKR